MSPARSWSSVSRWGDPPMDAGWVFADPFEPRSDDTILQVFVDWIKHKPKWIAWILRAAFAPKADAPAFDPKPRGLSTQVRFCVQKIHQRLDHGVGSSAGRPTRDLACSNASLPEGNTASHFPSTKTQNCLSPARNTTINLPLES